MFICTAHINALFELLCFLLSVIHWRIEVLYSLVRGSKKILKETIPRDFVGLSFNIYKSTITILARGTMKDNEAIAIQCARYLLWYFGVLHEHTCVRMRSVRADVTQSRREDTGVRGGNPLCCRSTADLLPPSSLQQSTIVNSFYKGRSPGEHGYYNDFCPKSSFIHFFFSLLVRCSQRILWR